MKACTRCKRSKELVAYRVMNSGNRRSVCISCEYEVNNRRNRKKSGPEPIRLEGASYYLTRRIV